MQAKEMWSFYNYMKTILENFINFRKIYKTETNIQGLRIYMLVDI